MEATAQLNVRIDPQLKTEGDRILAEHGLTPSRAIRSLYRSLTSGGERAEKAIEAIVEPDPHEQERRAEAERKLKLHSDFLAELENHYVTLGIPFGVPHPADWPSDDELLLEAKLERARERGLA